MTPRSDHMSIASADATSGSPAGDRVVAMRMAAIGLVALASTFAVAGEARTSLSVVGAPRGRDARTDEAGCRDDPCEEPAAGIVLRFTRNGRVVAEVTTTQAGRYFVRLAVRLIRRDDAAPPRRDGVDAARRPASHGTDRRVNFHLDTGIQ